MKWRHLANECHLAFLTLFDKWHFIAWYLGSKRYRTKEHLLKTARGHLMSPQQQLYNGLARPANYSIFAPEWTCPLRPSSLAYGQRGWLCGKPMLVRDIRQDGRTASWRYDGDIMKTYNVTACRLAFSQLIGLNAGLQYAVGFGSS